MNERRLVGRAKRGDAHAFAALVGHYERPMNALACSVLDSQWDAADAVQDAFIEAYQHIQDLRNPERFKAWLSRIVINKCRQSHRGAGKVVALDVLPEPACPGAAVGPEQTLDLIRAVRSLEPDHRDAIALRYFCDLKVEDIAQILGCPSGTVKSRLNRALSRLHMLLAEQPVRTYKTHIQEVAQ